MVKSTQRGSEMRAVGAGLLAWLVPGLGHFWLGHHWRGTIFLAAITTTFWGGVAIGGVKNTADPKGHPAWFVAALCTAGNTAVGMVVRSRLPEPPKGETSPYLAVWPADDLGLVYCGVAGLLNVLVILDAIARGGPRAGRERPIRSPVGRKGAG